MRGTPILRHDDPKILEQRYLLRYLHAIEKDNSELAARVYAQQRNTATITVEDPPIPFSPFFLADCTMLDHFSFNDFIAIAFPDIAGDLDIQI